MERLAAVEEKRLSEFTRELIEEALAMRSGAKRSNQPIAEGDRSQLNDTIEQLKDAIAAVQGLEPKKLGKSDLKLEKQVDKALRAALGAQFYARMAASGVNDLTSVAAEQIDAPELQEVRQHANGRMDQDCNSFVAKMAGL
ncbi:MAG: hypothetical protein ACRD3W_21275 [Terriglobales bacterium]